MYRVIFLVALVGELFLFDAIILYNIDSSWFDNLVNLKCMQHTLDWDNMLFIVLKMFDGKHWNRILIIEMIDNRWFVV